MKLGAPSYLWLLWVVLAALVFEIYVARTKRRFLARFIAPALLPRIAAGVSKPRQRLKTALVLAGLLACVFALAEVKWGFHWEQIERRGVDIVVALDVSDSMLAHDSGTVGDLSRLERAKRKIRDLLDLLDGDRVGIVAFAGAAFVQCPLTLDYSAASLFLDDVDTDIIPVKGTAIGEALRTSIGAFRGTASESQAVILITDGEDQTGEALEAAEEAKQKGVRVFAIGIGKPEGAPIPMPGGGFKKDDSGEMVISKLDETTLQKIALTTGGKYARSVTGDLDLASIYRDGIKASVKERELESTRRQRWEQRFQWPLGLALLLLALEPFVPERRRAGAARVSGAIVVLVLLAAPRAFAASAGDPYDAYKAGRFDQALAGFTDLQVEHPQDPRLLLHLGSAHYKMKNYDKASETFGQALLAGDPKIREKAMYNLGNTTYQQGKLEDAVEWYKQALGIDPDDQDAKYNLEFVRDEIRRRDEQNKKRQEQQKQQQQQGQKNQQNQKQDQQQQDQKQKDQQQQQQQQQDQQQGDQQKQQGEQQQQQQEQAAKDQEKTEGEQAQGGEKKQGEKAAEKAAAAGKMTKEEAERFLQGLMEDRGKNLKRQAAAKRGGGRRSAKDW